MTNEPDRTAGTEEIIAWLAARRSATNIAGMARYGINTSRAFGVSNADLRPLARRIGRNHPRALELWETGWREARLLATFTGGRKEITADDARDWADDFDSWEIVDSAADLFAEAGLGPVLIPEFAADEREFVRRAAFSMIAWSAVHLKQAPDSEILAWLPLIERHAGDGRNFVKKGVNWALRQIGKRSPACHAPALTLAEKLAACDDRISAWVGRDAVRELTEEKILTRFEGRG